jgi:hypothetical protein
VRGSALPTLPIKFRCTGSCSGPLIHRFAINSYFPITHSRACQPVSLPLILALSLAAADGETLLGPPASPRSAALVVMASTMAGGQQVRRIWRMGPHGVLGRISIVVFVPVVSRVSGSRHHDPGGRYGSHRCMRHFRLSWVGLKTQGLNSLRATAFRAPRNSPDTGFSRRFKRFPADGPRGARISEIEGVGDSRRDMFQRREAA